LHGEREKYVIYYHLIFNSHTYSAKAKNEWRHSSTRFVCYFAMDRATLPLPLVNSSRPCMTWMYLFYVLRRILQVIEERVVRLLCPNLRGNVIKSDGKMVINVSR
jgi:hypothetical protein